jgi:hypothetical protein
MDKTCRLPESVPDLVNDILALDVRGMPASEIIG